MSEHLTASELKLALNKELSPERMAEVGCHLTEGCPSCRAMLARAYRPSQDPLTPDEDAEYDLVIESAFKFAVRTEKLFNQGDSAVRKAAMIATAELAHMFSARDRKVITYETLLQWSWSVRHENPRSMVELASAAVHVANQLDPAIHGARKVADHQARAWGELGNAYRAADDHWEAHRAFGKAFQFLQDGTGDPLIKARLHDLHSSLLGDQRKFDLAFQNLDLVVALYKEINDLQSAGRALIKKAMYTHYSGRSEDALVINQKGLALIDEKRDPSLPVNALLNQLWFLVACGRFKDAKTLLFRNRRKIHEGGRILAIKLRWLDGQISYGLGDAKTAESIFQEVKEKLEAEALGFAAALASLDLAMAQMRQGKREEAKAVASEAAAVFAALNIHREVLGTVELLKDAFRLEMASAALVERVVSFIREWEINPEARFLPGME